MNANRHSKGKLEGSKEIRNCLSTHNEIVPFETAQLMLRVRQLTTFINAKQIY